MKHSGVPGSHGFSCSKSKKGSLRKETQADATGSMRNSPAHFYKRCQSGRNHCLVTELKFVGDETDR